MVPPVSGRWPIKRAGMTRVLFRTSTSPGCRCWSTSVNTPSVMDPSPRL